MSDKELYNKRDIEDVMDNFGLSWDESAAALYSRLKFAEPFKLLNQYDNKSVELPHRSSVEGAQNMMFADEKEWARVGREFYKLKPEQACNLVNFVKQKFPENHNFGIESEENSGKFAGIIDSLYQNVYGQELYPTPMAKAANLLYFVIKNHPFGNGNKRIAIFLFCMFLEMHAPDIIEKTTGYIAMPAVALFIALSSSQDKDLVVNFVMRLFQSLK